MTRISLIVFFFSLAASAGPRVGGGGGDTVTDTVKSLARNLVFRLEAYGTKKTDQIVTARQFKKIVSEAKIESVEQRLYINGVYKDAINYPSEKRIVFSRKSWPFISFESRLVFHEFLGLLQIPDEGFENTQLVFKELSKGEHRFQDKNWRNMWAAKELTRRLTEESFSHVRVCYQIGVFRREVNWDSYGDWLVEIAFPDRARATEAEKKERHASIDARNRRYEGDLNEAIFFLDALCEVPPLFPYKFKSPLKYGDREDKNSYIKRVKTLYRIFEKQYREVRGK